MTSFSFGRYAMGAIAAAAILTGCATQPQIAAPGAVRPPNYQTQQPNSNVGLKTVKIEASFTGSPDGMEPRTGVYQGPHTNAGFGVTLRGGDSNNDGTL